MSDEPTEIEGVNSYGLLQYTLMIEENPLISGGQGGKDINTQSDTN